MVEKLALANPRVALRLISNGRTLLHSYGDDSMLHAALAVYGRETAALLKPVDLALGGVHIWGLVGVGTPRGPIGRGRPYFINRRVVRCPPHPGAGRGVPGRVTIGMYPMCALHLDLPPATVDGQRTPQQAGNPLSRRDGNPRNRGRAV
jgi:DNA mismatch repair protein MutL